MGPNSDMRTKMGAKAIQMAPTNNSGRARGCLDNEFIPAIYLSYLLLSVQELREFQALALIRAVAYPRYNEVDAQRLFWRLDT